jgi:hypothetical protein
MLGMPLFKLWKNWELADIDVVETQWFGIDHDHNLHKSFHSLDIPYRLSRVHTDPRIGVFLCLYSSFV